MIGEILSGSSWIVLVHHPHLLAKQSLGDEPEGYHAHKTRAEDEEDPVAASSIFVLSSMQNEPYACEIQGELDTCTHVRSAVYNLSSRKTTRRIKWQQSCSRHRTSSGRWHSSLPWLPDLEVSPVWIATIVYVNATGLKYTELTPFTPPREGDIAVYLLKAVAGSDSRGQQKRLRLIAAHKLTGCRPPVSDTISERTDPTSTEWAG